MVGEAAQLLGLPSAALAEELAQTKVAPRPAAANSDVERRMSDEDSWQPTGDDPRPAADAAAIPKGADASAAAPPPEREMAFMQFLLANERDADLDGMAGEFLPREVFAHAFTWRFFETWRMEVSNGADAFATFAASLSGDERAWFDRVCVEAGKTQSSSLSVTDILQDFVRELWVARLKRVQGGLPAKGDRESDLLRMRISMDVKRLRQSRWAVVKDMIRDYRRNPQ
jgi:hypothetical protein